MVWPITEGLALGGLANQENEGAYLYNHEWASRIIYKVSQEGFFADKRQGVGKVRLEPFQGLFRAGELVEFCRGSEEGAGKGFVLQIVTKGPLNVEHRRDRLEAISNLIGQCNEHEGMAWPYVQVVWV